MKDTLLLNHNIVNKYYFKGANFNDIINIKNFDENLKALLFKSTLRIEKHFKSILIYEYSKHFEDYDYLKLEIYNKNFKTQALTTLEIFNKICAERKELKEFEKVPFNILIDFLTFGQVLYFANNLNDSFKNEIAKHFSKLLGANLNKNVVLSFEILKTYIDNIKEIRNIIAHDNRLFYFKASNNNKYLKDLHTTYNIDKRESRRSFYNILITFSCFLTVEQLQEFNNDFSNIKLKLANKLNQTVYSNLVHSLGLQN